MQQLSIVINCRNEANRIANTLKSFTGLTDDIVVYDNGSTDGTQAIVKELGAKLYEGNWEGFGKTKNKANELSKYDWVLSLDADEAIDEELKKNLSELKFTNEKNVYEFKFKNYLGNKWLRFGAWGHVPHIRLFNKKQVEWNDAEVHEKLIIPPEAQKIKISGYVLHQTAADLIEYKQKMMSYTVRSAEEYYRKNIKAGFLKTYFSPLFSFIRNYFLRFGFLDGRSGYDCALVHMHYTFLKYKKLRELYKN